MSAFLLSIVLELSSHLPKHLIWLLICVCQSGSVKYRSIVAHGLSKYSKSLNLNRKSKSSKMLKYRLEVWWASAHLNLIHRSSFFKTNSTRDNKWKSCSSVTIPKSNMALRISSLNFSDCSVAKIHWLVKIQHMSTLFSKRRSLAYKQTKQRNESSLLIFFKSQKNRIG